LPDTAVVEVRPPWPFRLPAAGSPDGVLRRRDGALRRLLHVQDAPVLVSVRQPARDRVVFAASAQRADAAAHAIERMRFALGVDDDLRPFYERFRFDGLIGRAVRARPRLRLWRRPEPFEALAWAICEQLIEFERAVGIERRIVDRLGRRCPETGLCDVPSPATVAGTAPARLQSFDLSAGRSLALIRCAREVAAGRIDLHAADHERAWARLRAIPGIGRWTIDMLAVQGQGRYDQVPAGDLGYLKLVGRLRTGNPRAVATEAEVRDLLEPYAPWQGLAAAHLHRASRAITTPVPAGTRSRRPASPTASV